ncbi:DUF2304 domain-containing protein [Enterococcus sp. 22-H-5-01]|uniref:DUF2304 domain-containing protein n=1 Tax=Enterococcus sp. 22-H-5-01 TaxID=3418555 RepID=UPI003D078ADB
MPIQLQVIAILLAVAYFILTVRMVRRDQADIRQMGKWLVLAFILLIGALFPALATRIANILGITTLTSLALYTLTGVLLVFTLMLHISLIKSQRNIKRLTQELSLLKKRVEDSERNRK